MCERQTIKKDMTNIKNDFKQMYKLQNGDEYQYKLFLKILLNYVLKTFVEIIRILSRYILN